MTIQLLALTPAETELLLAHPETATLRDLAVTPDALPPDFVLRIVLERHRTGEHWLWCAPRLYVIAEEKRIIGSTGFKHSPREGAVEIGYGVAESFRGRGYATEGLRLLLVEGLSQPEVTAITAETADSNVASQRVLEKTGFVRTGTRVDPEDGPLILWRLERSGVL